ncbi:MAG: peptidoglycan DD-metalloendopeptidase family protein [Rubellimicrobium sp.]|nr:peptidoglycan DD-metalloendopeptidase family protein [Rubellimicrobium sp.]
MPGRLLHHLHEALARRFPERRLFLRSDHETRFIRLHPETQAIAWTGIVLVVGWTIVATAIILMDSIGAGNFRAQAARDRAIYEDRLNAMSAERDLRLGEAQAAQARFSAALAQISTMQGQILHLEEQKRELVTGMEVIQTTLQNTATERDRARAEAGRLLAAAGNGDDGGPALNPGEEMAGTLGVLTAALSQTAAERDRMSAEAAAADDQAADLQLELRLVAERNDSIFRQIEEAMTISVEPFDNMFRAAGLNTGQILDTVRRGYSGQGGPFTPISFSTSNPTAAIPDADAARANEILNRLDELNLYRIAAQVTPFSMPLHNGYRLTSSFGARWGRQHAGLDMATPTGTPAYATADGTVIFAGWMSGYGNLIKIRHQFGIETRYAHLSRIRVEVGQRVSRGDRIGDTGSTGRSTGPHLHYEIRVGGEPINPTIYMRAGQNVF